MVLLGLGYRYTGWVTPSSPCLVTLLIFLIPLFRHSTIFLGVLDVPEPLMLSPFFRCADLSSSSSSEGSVGPINTHLLVQVPSVPGSQLVTSSHLESVSALGF